eukprot:TRINITY_DN8033_c0_g1_i1.p1 TRINITY_DN8033_c0_g1~~TRINITY_DN8033_c0_g1_i1.p1  ORF type:complete len:298 (+),score=31.88 TRINITY_DN8033_c0_g1_i1:23-895(+)
MFHSKILRCLFLTRALQSVHSSEMGLSPHAFTALPIAAARTAATEQGLLNDPLAKRLLGREGKGLVSNGYAPNVGYMTMRCLVGDELVLEMYERYGVRQVVSIGAGMDSRAFRLSGVNDARFFEVDSKDLFAMKEPLVADLPLKCAERNLVLGRVGDGFDLGQALVAQGFDPSLGSVWLLEGLVPYLTESNLVSVLAEIGNLAASPSAIWFDGFSKTSVQGGMVFHGVPFESGFDDYDEVLLKSGFSTAAVYSSDGVNVRNGRVNWNEAYRLSKERLQGRHGCLVAYGYK